jgi:hypothetical protein
MIVQQTAIQPPPLPPTPGASGSLVRLEDLLGRPVTANDVRDIRNRGQRLSDQLLSAQGRRDEVANELKATTDPAVREGLQQRLRVLDDRLATLEKDIAENSRLNAAVPPGLANTNTETRPAPMGSPVAGLSQGGFIAISIVFTIFVLAPIATAFARRLWRKPVSPIPNAQLAAQQERMERMEQAIDAVAIEVERISEGQRFVTQLLSKQRDSVAVGSGSNAEG